MIIPGKTIGVLGGGALSRLLSQAAADFGYRVQIYDPRRGTPAAEVSAGEVNAPYADEEALAAFARGCDVLTCESALIPVEPLWKIENLVPLRPHWSALEVCQNRIREKNWLHKNGFPHVRFTEVEAGDDLDAALRRIGPPCVVKAAESGRADLAPLRVTDEASAVRVSGVFGGARAIVERLVDFKSELAVVTARGLDGEVRTFPVSENIHSRQGLDFSIAPARIGEAIAAEATTLARGIAEKLGLVGVVVVALFLTDRGELLVNSFSPGCHPAGHFTLDGCATSQFDQQVRAICGLPLGDTGLFSPVATVMVSPAVKRRDAALGEPDWSVLLRDPAATLYLHGAAATGEGARGHFSVRGADGTQALEHARLLRVQLLRRPGGAAGSPRT